MKRAKENDLATLKGAKFLCELVADRLHVAEPLQEVARQMLEKTARFKESLALQAVRHGLKRFLNNRNTYRAVMGQDPLPSEAMVGRAMLDMSYRNVLLEELRA